MKLDVTSNTVLQLASEYSELKLQLAQRYPRDRAAYIEGKSAFVVRVLATTEGEAVVTTASAGGDSGFPSMIQDGTGRLMFAWTQTGEGRHVRVMKTKEAVQ